MKQALNHSLFLAENGLGKYLLEITCPNGECCLPQVKMMTFCWASAKTNLGCTYPNGPVWEQIGFIDCHKNKLISFNKLSGQHGTVNLLPDQKVVSSNPISSILLDFVSFSK